MLGYFGVILGPWEPIKPPYPSLSFGEYNSNPNSLSTPLVEFLEKQVSDLWEAEQRGSKNGPFLGTILKPILALKWALKVLQKWSKKLSKLVDFLGALV